MSEIMVGASNAIAKIVAIDENEVARVRKDNVPSLPQLLDILEEEVYTQGVSANYRETATGLLNVAMLLQTMPRNQYAEFAVNIAREAYIARVACTVSKTSGEVVARVIAGRYEGGLLG